MKYQNIIHYLFLINILFLSCHKKTDEIPEPIQALNLLTDCTNPLEHWEYSSTSKPDILTQQDVFFTSKNIGFTVGNYGTIAKTEDGGISWELMHHGDFENYVTRLRLMRVYFLNEEEGFIVGNSKGIGSGGEVGLGAIFLKTSDGGLTWKKHYLETIHSVADLYFINAEIGHALFNVKNENGDIKQKLMQTENGGETWTKVDLPIFRLESSRFYTSPTKFYAIAKNTSGKDILVYFDKSNMTWHLQDAPHTECNRLYFINDDVGFVTCAAFPGLFSETVYKTEDGGTTWLEVAFPFTASSFFHFSSLEEGFSIVPIFEDYTEDTDEYIDIIAFDIFQTDNGGIDWKKSSYTPDCHFIGEVYYNKQLVIMDDMLINYGARNINFFKRK